MASVSAKSGEASGGFTPFACVAIVGVGMMGGSLGLALRSRRLARTVVGVDRNSDTLAQAQALGAIDRGVVDLAAGVREADAIVLAAPVGAIPALLESLASAAPPDALITDLGSTKSTIVSAGERLFGMRFIGGHPMAGSEKSGIEAAQAELFDGAAWAIVRSKVLASPQDAFAQRLTDLALALGAHPLTLDMAQHDRLVALISHLPHLLSFAFARTIQADSEAEMARALGGGSYRDLMRVSGADPILWNGIFQQNRDALLAALAAYEAQLQTLKQALEINAEVEPTNPTV